MNHRLWRYYLLFYLSCFLLAEQVHAQAWIQKADCGGPGRYSSIAFSIGDKGYIGLGSDQTLNEFNDLWEWDQKNNTWSKKTDFPGKARYGAGAFSIGKKGYVVVGGTGGNTIKELWEWNGDTASPSYNTWARKTDFPGGLVDPVCFSIGKKGYLATGSYTRGLWEWDADTASPTYNTWKQKADFPLVAGRGWAVGFSIGLKGYLGTGTDGAEFKKDFWEWDGDISSPTYDTWIKKADLPGSARLDAVGFSIGAKGYIGTGLGSTNLRDFWEWDQATDTWIQKPDFAGLGRGEIAGFSIGNKGYIGTGSDANGLGTTDFWEYCDSCTVGIREHGDEISILIYPNPTYDKIFIQQTKETDVEMEVKLLTILGEVVQNRMKIKNKIPTEINVSGLAEGIYFVQIKEDKNLIIKKIIVLH